MVTGGVCGDGPEFSWRAELPCAPPLRPRLEPGDLERDPRLHPRLLLFERPPDEEHARTPPPVVVVVGAHAEPQRARRQLLDPQPRVVAKVRLLHGAVANVAGECLDGVARLAALPVVVGLVGGVAPADAAGGLGLNAGPLERRSRSPASRTKAQRRESAKRGAALQGVASVTILEARRANLPVRNTVFEANVS